MTETEPVWLDAAMKVWCDTMNDPGESAYQAHDVPDRLAVRRAVEAALAEIERGGRHDLD